MLQVERLTKNFGGLAAVSLVDMSVRQGELVGLIGPNGAGKTTFFNLLTGYIKPSEGRVRFEGKDITGRKPHRIASAGIVRSFQQDNVFAEFTVLDNLRLAQHLNSGINFWQTVFSTGGARRREREIRQEAEEILELVGISQLAGTAAGSLPHGHKRMLGIAIALACRPKLLLLDEPLAGMNIAEVDETIALVRRLWENGTTILLIEHNMRAAMSVCQRFCVLNFGRKIAEGTPDEIKNDPEVVKAYLGTGSSVA
ncbi:MAG: ABC transporter ATP-binding protein [Actinobacteria bacterium]|jgi:branched-chain amino acid transport system ATP-binding protein|nr:ABC transporter ATP-binding protein [Actinomycetota bacterium]